MAAELSTLEGLTLKVCRSINENPKLKTAQGLFLRHFSAPWVGVCIRNLLEVHGLERLHKVPLDRGVILCANHRSFFDLYAVAAVLYKQDLPWNRKHFYPVRSNFFYESLAGLGVNLLIGGGSMYPPIYRDRDKAERTKESIDSVIRLLGTPGNVVGLHPEGKRGKGDDPYELLPAQPGVGQIAYKSRATVVPIWIRGLSNDFSNQIKSNFASGEKRGENIVIEFGEPVDLSQYLDKNGRASVYKRISDKIMADIGELSLHDKARNAP